MADWIIVTYCMQIDLCQDYFDLVYSGMSNQLSSWIKSFMFS